MIEINEHLELRQGDKLPRRSKALATEREFPHIVEIELPFNGLEVRMLRAMSAFFQKRNIKLRFGRSRREGGHLYGRWCFSEPAIAEEFRQQFGGVRVGGKN